MKHFLALAFYVLLVACNREAASDIDITGCYELNGSSQFSISQNLIVQGNTELAHITLLDRPSGIFYETEPAVFVLDSENTLTIQIDPHNERLSGIAESDWRGNFYILVPTDATPGEGRRTLIRARKRSQSLC